VNVIEVAKSGRASMSAMPSPLASSPVVEISGVKPTRPHAARTTTTSRIHRL